MFALFRPNCIRYPARCVTAALVRSPILSPDGRPPQKPRPCAQIPCPEQL